MPRRSSKTLTEAEQRVMQALWRHGEATVRQVVDDLCRDRPVAYNTVLTILGILHRKKYVRFRRDGRAHVYRATVSETEARREAFDELIARFFGGSSHAFAEYLVNPESLDAEELQHLRDLIQEKRRRRSKKR